MNSSIKQIKIKCLLIIGAALLLGNLNSTFAQVKIGDNPATIDANSLLELESTNKGLLLPRVALMGTTSASPMSAHIVGMSVFNTATIGDVTPGIYFNDGSQWVRLEGVSDGWKTTGNLGTNPATNFLGTKDAQDLVLRTNNTEKMRLTSNGFLGIGTTTPFAPLQFSNSTENRKIVLWNGVSNNDHQFYGFGINPHTLRYQVNASAADHVFYAGASSTTSNELMRIKGNGNVGIGTTTPRGKFDVDGPGDIYLSDAVNGGSPQRLFLPGNIFLAPYGSSDISFLGARRESGAGNTSLRFRTVTSGSLRETMHLNHNGNVGIGTISPVRTLDVRGSGVHVDHANAEYNVWIQGGTATSGDARNLALLGQSTWDLLHVGFFNEFDYVRLGPSVRVQVYSNTWKPISASAFNTASDRNLKENIRPLNNYKDILKIQPKRFDWKDKELMPIATNDVGIIAQDVQRYFPEFVTKSELKDSIMNRDYEFISVDYSKLVVPVLGVIQEHEANIETLQNENEALREENQLIRDELDNLKTQLRAIQKQISNR